MKIKAIFGLGNPGRRYSNTYHNVGSLFIDNLLRNYDSESVKKYNQEYSVINIGEKKIMLVKPYIKDEFMNDSGIYIKSLMKLAKLKSAEILVVHDDSDFPLGKYRHSFGKASAGHKGVQSIIDTLRTKTFHRIRVGIRKRPGKALDFVLKEIPKKDMAILDDIFEAIRIHLEKELQSD